MPDTVLLFAAVVALAFCVEGALGFGATLVTVSLAALFMPISELLAAFVPVNVVLSSLIVLRERRHVDRALLFRRVVPLMVLGLPIGMYAVRQLDPRVMKVVFGVFVSALSLFELAADLRRKDATAPRPISRPVLVSMLIAGGAVHGAFGTGGPMAVYVVGRALTDKAAFRATLSALWLCLNGFLVGGFIWDGTLDRRSLATSAALIPSLLIGLFVGDAFHKRVSLPLFRVLVFVLLTVVGIAVAVRAW